MSACLAGVPCRYDGASKARPACVARLMEGDVLLLCPECMGGLPTPRPASEIPGGRAADVLTGDTRMMNRAGEDVTEAYLEGARRVLALCRERGIREVWLKSKSPACGCDRVYDGSFTGRLVEGNGILAQVLLDAGIRVITVD